MLRYTKKNFEYKVSIDRDGAYAYNAKSMKCREIVVCADALHKKSRDSTYRTHLRNKTTYDEWQDDIFNTFVENVIYYALVERTCNATSIPYGLAEYKNQLYVKCNTLCRNPKYKKGCQGCQCDMFPTFALRTNFQDVIEENEEDEYDIRFKAIQKKHRENHTKYNM